MAASDKPCAQYNKAVSDFTRDYIFIGILIIKMRSLGFSFCTRGIKHHVLAPNIKNSAPQCLCV